MPAPSMLAAAALAALCLVSCAVLLHPAVQARAGGRALAKLAASTCFVAVALVLGAGATGYGRLVLGALLLGWVGDACLLSERRTAFLAGLAAFLLAHVLYALAFVSTLAPPDPMARPISPRGWLQPVAPAVLAAGCLALLVGWRVWRWLGPHLPAGMRAPVLSYVLVILLMCVAAAAHVAAGGRGIVLVGALLFAASDLAVARERFVQRSAFNQQWGLPTYFIAQLLLAASVGV